ncbi:MAG: hypothetical protein L3K06_08900 [Thermoplasmata archaeon]|nr:hypothetical protein [Thermoplasmata archaeon]
MGVALGVALVLLAGPPQAAARPVSIDRQFSFTGQETFAAATLSGDIHVNFSGNWTASSPTWAAWGHSGPEVGAPPCFPRCGNATTSGAVAYTADYCIAWPGGGTSYAGGAPITLFIYFTSSASSGDIVHLHATMVESPSSACG